LRARPAGLTTIAALVALGLVGSGAVAAKPSPIRFVVREGDTLSAIAAWTKIPVAELMKANGIGDARRLQPGQVLVLPAASKSAAAKPVAPAPKVAAKPAPKPAPKDMPGYHVVRVGETTASIAAKERVPAQLLVIANGILPGEPLFVGARLRLTMPAKITKAPKAGGTGAGVHTVAKGDNLAKIAKRYGTTIADIAKRNTIRNPNRVLLGTQLVVPNAGGFRCPVVGAHFVNDFGLPRGEGTRFHQGNDLLAPRGTPVVAPVAGTVEQHTGSVGGRQFWLRGDDGNDYLGSHLDRFAATGHVDAGAVVGYVGDSGDALGGPTHLHFEIHPGRGEAVNPYPILATACRR
jgi:LysM repeat protein